MAPIGPFLTVEMFDDASGLPSFACCWNWYYWHVTLWKPIKDDTAVLMYLIRTRHITIPTALNFHVRLHLWGQVFFHFLTTVKIFQPIFLPPRIWRNKWMQLNAVSLFLTLSVPLGQVLSRFASFPFWQIGFLTHVCLTPPIKDLVRIAWILSPLKSDVIN